MTLSASGAISGTPIAAVANTFTVTATDSSLPTPLTAKARLSITVNGPNLVVTTSTLPSGDVGVAYPGAALALHRGDRSHHVGGDLGQSTPGLNLDGSSGAITGIPTGPGEISAFTVTATDVSSPQQSASANLTIVIASVPLVATAVTPVWWVSPYPGATLASTGGTAGHLGRDVREVVPRDSVYDDERRDHRDPDNGR